MPTPGIILLKKTPIAMETAGKELGRFDANAHLDIGTSGHVPDRLKIQGETSDATKYALRVTNLAGSNLFSVRNDGIISFGPSNNLFPLLALQNLVVIVGRVNRNGTKNSGEGFTSAPIPNVTADYRITFTSAFASNPFVLVTASESSSRDDNVANTFNITPARFDVSILTQIHRSEKSPLLTLSPSDKDRNLQEQSNDESPTGTTADQP